MTKEDDTSNQFWKSRDIPAQETVFVSKPQSTYFKNWHDFQEYKVSMSIEIPLYLIQKALKQHIIDVVNVSIGTEEEQKETIYVIRKGFYTTFLGFTLNVNNDSVFL